MMVMLAYVSGDGYLAVQSRRTSNGTTMQFDAFSIPLKARQGDGSHSTGIAAFDAEGLPLIYFCEE
jgi:hypothetical protein